MRFTTVRSLLIGSLAVGSASIVLAFPAPMRVHLTDGRTLDVQEYRMESGQAVLTFPEGGTIAFPSFRVARVEQLPPPPPPDPKPDAPKPPEETGGPDAQGTAGQTGQRAATLPAAAEPDTIETMVRQAAEKYGLEVDLLAAVIAVESGYRSDAVSPKGAQGLMQLMPATAKELAVSDPFDPAQNIDAGARYLRQLLDQHGDSYVRALAAYNAGPGRVERYRGIPPYRETIQYIRSVLKKYAAPAGK